MTRTSTISSSGQGCEDNHLGGRERETDEGNFVREKEILSRGNKIWRNCCIVKTACDGLHNESHAMSRFLVSFQVLCRISRDGIVVWILHRSMHAFRISFSPLNLPWCVEVLCLKWNAASIPEMNALTTLIVPEISQTVARLLVTDHVDYYASLPTSIFSSFRTFETPSQPSRFVAAHGEH